MARESATNVTNAKKVPTVQDRLRAAADHLDSFASVAPLIFTVSEGEQLLCVRTHGPGPIGPDPEDAYGRYYKAIMEIDAALKQLGCEGPEGQTLRDGYVMVWQDWSWLNPTKQWPSPATEILTLGKAIVRNNESRRRQVGMESKHPWSAAIPASWPQFARHAAAEARASAKRMPPSMSRSGATTVLGRTPTQIRASTPPLDQHNLEWLPLKQVVKELNIKPGTLGGHRRAGWTDDDHMLGCDSHGRVWRRALTKGSHPWYWGKTLKSALSPGTKP